MAQTFPISHGAAEYPARCSLGDLANIEAACGAYGADGVRKPKAAALILSDLIEQRFSRLDAQEPFRVAIIAGGAPAGEAARIVEAIYEADGLSALVGLSLAVLQIALMGVPRETAPEVKKKAAPQPLPIAAIRMSLLQAGVDPAAVYGMSYADWVEVMRAAPGDTTKPPPDPQAVKEGAEAFKAMMRAAKK